MGEELGRHILRGHEGVLQGLWVRPERPQGRGVYHRETPRKAGVQVEAPTAQPAPQVLS